MTKIRIGVGFKLLALSFKSLAFILLPVTYSLQPLPSHPERAAKQVLLGGSEGTSKQIIQLWIATSFFLAMTKIKVGFSLQLLVISLSSLVFSCQLLGLTTCDLQLTTCSLPLSTCYLYRTDQFFLVFCHADRYTVMAFIIGVYHGKHISLSVRNLSTSA